MSVRTFFDYEHTTDAAPAPDTALLAGCTEQDWAMVLSHTQTRRFRTGETVMAAGEQDRSLYILTEGELRVAGLDRAPIAAPATIGEMAFFSGHPRSQSLVAAADGEMLRLSFDAFLTLAARDPRLGRELLLDLGRIVSARLRAVEAKERR